MTLDAVYPDVAHAVSRARENGEHELLLPLSDGEEAVTLPVEEILAVHEVRDAG